MVAGWKDVLAFGAIIATLANAAPIDYFPINSQLPPVARISQDFSFTFSPLTFSSPSNITYRLANAPKWLSIDSSSRRLFGTPSDDDVPPGEVVGIPIDLVAEDDEGSTTASSVLVISRNPPPTVAVPISEQLPNFGSYAAPSSILLHPSKPFSFSFSEGTFRTKNGDGGLNYYAVSGDNVPLPSWVAFDAATLTFSGETPPFESLVQPPQNFVFQLVASDVVGFASVSISFSIVVGNHELTADPPVIKLNATQGKPFKYEGLSDVLKLDKKPIKPDDVMTISALDLPSWLSFDNETWSLDGTPESTAESSNVTIFVVDKYSDTLNLTLSINFALFVSDLPDLDLEPGKDFSFNLKRYLSTPSGVQVEVGSEPDAPWARFDSTSMTLSGTAPEPQPAKLTASLSFSFNVTSKHTNETEMKTMRVHIASPSSTKPSHPTESTKPTDPDADASKRNLLWLLIIPLLLVCIGVILLIFYVRRRRRQPAGIDIREVSGPVPGTFTANRAESLAESSARDVRKMFDIEPPLPSNASTLAAQNSREAAASSNQRDTRSRSTSPSLSGNIMPHAMAMHSGARSPENSVIFETSTSWAAGQSNKQSQGRSGGGTDEVSLLSDTSLGEEEIYIAEAHLSTIQRHRAEAFRGLEIPRVSGPSSIQATPEMAYIASRRHDYTPGDATPPAVGYAARSKSCQQQDSGLGLRSAGRRLSQLWKRDSESNLSNHKDRNSIISSSTGQTTRTSILTSGIAEEEATTSTNMVARPTIIHIPSRPGEARQMSRRISESSPLFGGRSVTKSPRNYGLGNNTSPEFNTDERPELPPNLEEFIAPRDSDSSWDRLARNSLGIAYRDLVTTFESGNIRAEPETPPGTTRENWIVHSSNQDLLSPGQWLQSNMSGNMVGIAKTSPANTSSELPRLPPPALAAPRDEGRMMMERRLSRTSTPNFSRTPSTSSRPDASHTPREGQSRISRIRKQRAPDEIRVMEFQMPSPESGWAPPTRPLPDTPTRSGRIPLGERPNGSYYAPGKDEQSFDINKAAPKSRKSTRSMKSAKSLRGVWADEDDDDDDEWEDIRPPTTIDGWDDDDSEGSFAVYI
ncbi:polarity establishment/cellular polarization [Parahypoxylon ruwenzoriense]